MHVLHLTTLDTVFLIITACAVSLFFLVGAIFLAAGLVLVRRVKKVVAKAELAIDSVEAATLTIKHLGVNASGPLAMFKVIKSIVDIVNRKK